MNTIMKKTLGNKLIFSSDGKKNRKRVSVRTFFAVWKDRIDTEQQVYDFSFCTGNQIRMKWYQFDYFDNYVEYDMVVTLDESILNDKMIMSRLCELEKQFHTVIDVSREQFLEKSSLYAKNQKMKEKSYDVMKKYAKEWKLPENLPENDLYGIAKWIENNRLSIVHSPTLKLSGPIERIYMGLLTGLCGGLFIGGISLSLFKMISSSFMILALYPAVVGFAISGFLLILVLSFERVMNERTYNDFLEDFEEFEEARREEKIRQLRKEYEKTSALFFDFVMAEKTHMQSLSDYNELEMMKEAQEVIGDTSMDNLSVRFGRMKRLLDWEREIYACEGLFGTKSEIVDIFAGDVLERRLAYLGFSFENIEKDSFFTTIKFTIRRLQEFPFYGVEVEIIRLLDFALDYAETLIRYADENAFVASGEYREFAERRLAMIEVAMEKLSAMKRWSDLSHSREELDRVCEREEKVAVPSGQEKRMLFVKLENGGSHQ